ncbi:putative protein arginine methyltransferase NDUFAF7 [[Candida] railenensis]|uniref:Protein arginine methyltransferase NDUFAF7 n=1 Tax=[Candida] railenensis TaxID=45579 RepID=A0A9P0VYC1_9ASCO|nr:putative protein arginine methyltransferase NDUFAF7 [[Candida] railenensis]
MLSRFRKQAIECSRSFHSSPYFQQKDEKLHFGKFSQKEYDEAAKIVQEQVTRLEKSIKGEIDPRSKMGTMPTIPISPSLASSKGINSLSDILIQSINTTGPISLSAYMRQCLTHPEYGYYTTRDPLDSTTGDFITSPEISSVFGEMIGVWLYSVWVAQGSPDNVRIIEFGPGKGTLMHDVLQSFNKLRKDKVVNTKIVMIEASPVLRMEQWKLLCKSDMTGTTHAAELSDNLTSTTMWGNSIEWVDTEKDIESDAKLTNYILAHEFFDALPIKSFQKVEDGWRELLVEHSGSVNNTQPKIESASNSTDSTLVSDDLLNTDFHLTMAPKETPSSFIPKNNPRFAELPIDSRIEICPDSGLYANKMADLVKESGACLIMDYGLSSGVPDNTLRGIYKHKFVSPFYKPGEVDLSIDVDFESIKQMTSGICNVYGPVQQGDWLHEVGIGYRVDQLIKSTNDYKEQEKIYDSYVRLTAKDDKSMGKVYKFLTLLPKSTSAAPIGFLNL